MNRLQRVRHLFERFYSATIRSESMYALAMRQYRESVLSEEIARDPKTLAAYGWSGYSQNDEDGIVQEIFARIGTTERRFVEFGSGDCLLNTGTYLLLTGWKGMWMDSEPGELAEIRRHFGLYEQSGDLEVKQAFITPENINDLLAGSPAELDLLIIDIDGNDYYIWQAIHCIRPRVVMIEYNATFRPPAAVVQPCVSVFQGASGNFNGCSLQALELLGREKQYVLVGCNFSGTNAFFVREDLVGDRFSAPFTAAHHYREQWLDGMNWGYTRQPRTIGTAFRLKVLDAAAGRTKTP